MKLKWEKNYDRRYAGEEFNWDVVQDYSDFIEEN